MFTVHVKQVGLNEKDEIAFIADFPHEKCLTRLGKEPDKKNPCFWCNHEVSFPPEALINRLHGYSRKTLKQAFDTIVRENALRLHHAVQPELQQKNGLKPEGDSLIDVHGGLHSQVIVKHSKHRLSEVLAFYDDLFQLLISDQEKRTFSNEVANELSKEHRSLLIQRT